LKVNNLSLENFRNYSFSEVELDQSLNIFFGMNAQGKTNLLESVYISSIGKSYRASKDSELINWDKDFFRIKTCVNRNNSDITLELALSREGRKLAKINGKPSRASELNDFLKVVLFTPEDLNLIKGSPSCRRNFIDMEISQISFSYKKMISLYNKAVLNRNIVLKKIADGNSNINLLESFTDQVLELGSRIMIKRIEFINSISKMADLSHRQISGYDDELKILYYPSFKIELASTYDDIKYQFRKKIDSLKNIEIMRGTTLVGPHRDDISFEIGEINVQTYGSQGQQRSVVLALKIAELDFIKLTTQDNAVFLLDDVLSELDEKRREHLMDKAIIKYQTLITSADIEYWKFIPLHYRKFEVSKGNIVVK